MYKNANLDQEMRWVTNGAQDFEIDSGQFVLGIEYKVQYQ
jgi:hypothetical protein